eukprot:ANDGO_06752.mRNA.1 DNA-directed RNA polymerases I and III subunit RPAC2
MSGPIENDEIMVTQDAKVEFVPGSEETCATLSIRNEDHTMGNAIRYILMKNPDVEFAGYAIPHPLEAKLHLRVQTYDVPVKTAVQDGLSSLMEISKHIQSAFEDAIEKFEDSKMDLDA